VSYWSGSNHNAGNWWASNWHHGGDEPSGNDLVATVSGAGSVSAVLTFIDHNIPSPPIVPGGGGGGGGVGGIQWLWGAYPSLVHGKKKKRNDQDEANELAELLEVLNASGF
jgi:hypothetical protein